MFYIIIKKMNELIYKMKLINLLEKYSEWFYYKSNRYNKLFKKNKNKIKLDLEQVTKIEYNKSYYTQLKKDLTILVCK